MKKISILVFSIVFLLSVFSVYSAEKNPNLHILLSNDDGYNAPGLKALVEAFSGIADVTVSAPADQQSGAGHGITYREAIFVRQIKNPQHIMWYAVSARPATCVHIGLENLVKRKPDLVISGINRGENIGLVTFRSGTIGAAREAAILGFPAIATSLQGDDKDDYKAAASYIRDLAKKLISKKLLHNGLLLNVNFPQGIAKGIKGTRITKLALVDQEHIYHKTDFPLIWLYHSDEIKHAGNNDSETDVNAFARGFVTITPLSLDETNYSELNSLKVLTND